MKGRRVFVVCNLKPAKMIGGFVSNGMVLCAKQGDKVLFVDPPADAPVGTRLVPETFTGGSTPLGPNQVKKRKAWEAVAEHLRTNEAGEATWQGIKLLAGGQPGVATGMSNAPIS
uniref:tRNA-binding domain-containing protein n=2 Tax=Rhizochromulina marina TaxID=1034831 RepID=A0A7S2WTE0_9STRA|mmetsp:Transcript_32983/g.95500  ORF Transcript_32983/g.95500 Transcript_32983/m.95500 type:complete len:115 (+) Transcript_32983:149-493(+)